MSLITEITRGIDALSISPFLVIDDNLVKERVEVFKKTWFQ